MASLVIISTRVSCGLLLQTYFQSNNCHFSGFIVFIWLLKVIFHWSHLPNKFTNSNHPKYGNPSKCNLSVKPHQLARIPQSELTPIHVPPTIYNQIIRQECTGAQNRALGWLVCKHSVKAPQLARTLPVTACPPLFCPFCTQRALQPCITASCMPLQTQNCS